MGGLISERDVARILGLSLATVALMRREGRGPKFYRLGIRKLGYRPLEVEAWLADRANVALRGTSPAASAPLVAPAEA
jgi:predicted DNA-binding transcriptional regulator AlpA